MSEARDSNRKLIFTLFVVAAVAAALCWPAAPASAKKYNEKSLMGTYQFTVSEARVDGADVVHCDSFGTIVFDGNGHAQTLMELRKCIHYPSGLLEIDEDDLGDFDYQVLANGEFLLIELDDVTGLPTDYVTHGRIVDGGKLLLVDGTGGCDAGPPPTCFHPDFLQTVAVAAKE